MKKALGFTLVSLALAALAGPVHAGKMGGSLRADVGTLDSQVPYFGTNNVVSSLDYLSKTTTVYSDRKNWNWDFTGRFFWYINCSPCAPCPTYIAASWQGSDHSTDSEINPHTESATSQALIPIRTNGISGFLLPHGTITVQTGISISLPVTPILTTITTYDTVNARVNVHNEFSKAKLGVGFDLIKTPCFAFSMEVGGNYLKTSLSTEKVYDLTAAATPPSTIDGLINGLVTGNIIVAPTFSANLGISALANSAAAAITPAPYTFVYNINEKDTTEGMGLYAMIKGEYKFPVSCLGNCFGIYGKAEVSDFIGRQTYTYDFNYIDHYAQQADRAYSYQEEPERQYNNIVEVDLEAALTYSPCCKYWDDLDMNFALGVRTDSFVNLFAHPTYNNNQSVLSLTRPSIFFEVELKM